MDVNRDRIIALRERIATGRYEIDPVAVADALIGRLRTQAASRRADTADRARGRSGPSQRVLVPRQAL